MALSPEIPDWFYMWNVKETLAHQTLAARARTARLVLPEDRAGWAGDQAEALIAALKESPYDIIGDLAELRPRPARDPAVRPDDSPAGEMLDAATEAAAAAVLHHYQKLYPAVRPQRVPATARSLVSRVESKVASSDKFKRTVRELSSRYPAVRQLRLRVWQATERRRVRRNS
jgi:hypothetical protein